MEIAYVTRKAKRATRNARLVNSDTCDADTTAWVVAKRRAVATRSARTAAARLRGARATAAARSAQRTADTADPREKRLRRPAPRDRPSMPRSRGNRRDRLVRAEPFQRAFPRQAAASQGNVAEVSDALGMSKKTLYHELRQLKSMTVRWATRSALGSNCYISQVIRVHLSASSQERSLIASIAKSSPPESVEQLPEA